LLANVYLNYLDPAVAVSMQSVGAVGVMLRRLRSVGRSRRQGSAAADRAGKRRADCNCIPRRRVWWICGGDSRGFVSLGCTFRKKRGIVPNLRWHHMYRWPSPKTMQRLRDRIREMTSARSSGEDVKQIIVKPNPPVRGWENFSGPARARGNSSRCTDSCIRGWCARCTGEAGSERCGGASGQPSSFGQRVCTDCVGQCDTRHEPHQKGHR
jgi:hypothetical protein